MMKFAFFFHFIFAFSPLCWSAEIRDFRQFENDVEEQMSRSPFDFYLPIHPSRGEFRSGFGVRKGYGGQRAKHLGIDIIAAQGTSVLAAKAGIVVRVFSGCRSAAVSELEENQGTQCGDGFGNHIMIRHDDGRETLYAHLLNSCRVRMKLNQDVVARQPIGCVGNSGRSKGPHLHFEVHDGRDAIDPAFVLGDLLKQYRH